MERRQRFLKSVVEPETGSGRHVWGETWSIWGKFRPRMWGKAKTYPKFASQISGLAKVAMS